MDVSKSAFAVVGLPSYFSVSETTFSEMFIFVGKTRRLCGSCDVFIDVDTEARDADSQPAAAEARGLEDDDDDDDVPGTISRKYTAS